MANGQPMVLLNSWFVRLREYLGLAVPEHLESNLLQLQYAQLTARIPFLYFAIATVAFVGAAGDRGPFSWITHVAFPGFFLAIGIARGFVWYRRKKNVDPMPAEKIKKRLFVTAVIALVMSIVGAAWTMHAYNATPEIRRVLCPIFLFMIVFASVICVINQPRVVATVIPTALGWPTVVMVASDDIGLRSVGLCFVVIGIMMVFLAWRQFADTVSGLQLRSELRALADTDGLTGLANRRAFERKFEEISNTDRNHLAFDIVMIDLDGFKQVNDDYGHAAGDFILQEVAQRLRSLCSSASCIARMGGDEFALILQVPDDEGFSAEQDDALRTLLGLPYIFNDNSLRISASVGRARCQKNGYDLQQLLKYADDRLYQDKAGASCLAAKTGTR